MSRVFWTDLDFWIFGSNNTLFVKGIYGFNYKTGNKSRLWRLMCITVYLCITAGTKNTKQASPFDPQH